MRDKKLRKEVTNRLFEWLDDESLIPEYSDFEFPEGVILIDLFHYKPPKRKGDLVGMDGESLSSKLREVVLPYGRILKKGPVAGDSKFLKSLETGDIVTLPDWLMEVERNPHYDMYREAMKERPKPEVEMPSPIIPKLGQWNRYVFIADKISTIDGDSLGNMVYRIPQSEVVAKVPKEWFDRYKVSEVEVQDVS